MPGSPWLPNVSEMAVVKHLPLVLMPVALAARQSKPRARPAVMRFSLNSLYVKGPIYFFLNERVRA